MNVLCNIKIIFYSLDSVTDVHVHVNTNTKFNYPILVHQLWKMIASTCTWYVYKLYAIGEHTV